MELLAAMAVVLMVSRTTHASACRASLAPLVTKVMKPPITIVYMHVQSTPAATACRYSNLILTIPVLDPCRSSPCLNGGTCSANGTAFTCNCPTNFLGTVCQQRSFLCLCLSPFYCRGSALSHVVSLNSALLNSTDPSNLY